MTQVGESGFEVALGASDAFGAMMANMTINESRSDLHSEREGRRDIRQKVPNGGSSIMEEDQGEDESASESADEGDEHSNVDRANEKDPFHPDMMQALIAEGQEAMWMEDEVSTVASVYVKPKGFSFRLKKEKKVHVRQKKLTKTVVLLPQEGDGQEQMLVDNCAPEGITHRTKETLLAEGHAEIDKAASNAEDSVSTLGLQTDTFEYQMAPAPSQERSQLTSYHNMDLMSISSLNEILDGPVEESIETSLSPRKMLPEILIPTKASQAAIKSHKEMKQSNKWGILEKFRLGGKHAKFNLQGVDEELAMPSIDEREVDEHEDEDSVKEVTGEKSDAVKKTIADVPGVAPVRSNISASNCYVSQASHNDIPVTEDPDVDGFSDSSSASSSSSQSSASSASSEASEVMPSRSAESLHRLDTAKSDWDQSKGFRRNPKAPIVDQVEETKGNIDPENEVKQAEEEEDISQEESIVLAPSRSMGAPTDSPPATPRELTQTQSDIETERTKMMENSIVNLSEEESTQANSNAESDVVPPTACKMSATVDTQSTCATKDIRSTLGNAGVETVAESVLCATKDIRSTLGNAGVETVAESLPPFEAMSAAQSVRSQSVRSQSVRSLSVQSQSAKSQSSGHAPSVRPQSVRSQSNQSDFSQSSRSAYSTSMKERYLRSDPDGSKEDATVAPTIASRRHANRVSSRQQDYFRNGNRSQQSASVFEAPITAMFRDNDESTTSDKDSLIDFVISPRRANIVTPGGSKPYVAYRRGDELSTAMIPTLAAISERPSEVAGNEATQGKDTKPKKRFPGIFGNRMSKAHPKSTILTVEKTLKPLNTDKTLSGEGDDEPNTSVASSTTSKDRHGESDSMMILNKVIETAVSKAEEANLEVMTAPFPHKRHHHRKLPGETRPVPNDLVEAIRMQTGRERERTARAPRESVGDAPGVSFSMDPENDTTENEAPTGMDPTDEVVTSIRILAPTPRNRPSTNGHAAFKTKIETTETDEVTVPDGEGKEENAEIKYDQRKVTERLYGPIESMDSFIGNHTKVEVNKGVYIGDLLGFNGEQNNSAAEEQMNAENVKDKENENALAGAASPKEITVPSKRGRRSLFGLRRNGGLPTAH